MKIELIPTISEIAIREWEKAKLDFSSLDGVYSFAFLNEQIETLIKPQYLRVCDNNFITFCLVHSLDVNIFSKKSELGWLVDFFKDYFGDEILNHVLSERKEKISLIILPALSKVDTLGCVENIRTSFMNTKSTSLVFSTVHSIDELGYMNVPQEPLLYVDLSNIQSYDSFLASLPSKKRTSLTRDEKSLIENDIIVKPIKVNDYLDEILKLNAESKYSALDATIKQIPLLEKQEYISTIGLFKNEKLVQYISVLFDFNVKISHVLASNLNEETKQWNGAFNTYRLFIKESIRYDVEKAYLSFKAENAKIKRGAIKLVRYLTVYKS